MVDKYGLREKLRLNTTSISAVFDELNSLWRLTTDGGQQITGRYAVMERQRDSLRRHVIQCRTE